MGRWYEADHTWAAIGVKDREEYVQCYVFEGCFHAKVPKDVVEAYQTAEHLMALAWYHYPMYDEALKKLLGILEMAVKLKCKQVGIDLEFVNKRGKTEEHKLATLIDNVCAQEKEKDLRDQLHLAREMRNYFAHPVRHSFSGGFIQLPFIPLINVLNLLFLDIRIVSAGKNRLKQLKKQYSTFQKGLFGLGWNGENILITQAEPLYVFQKKGLWYVFWYFFPLQPNFEESVTPPILLVLSYPDQQGTTFLGREIKTNQDVRVLPVQKALEQLLLPDLERRWREMPLEKQKSYNFFLRNEEAKQFGLLQYQYCWV